MNEYERLIIAVSLFFLDHIQNNVKSAFLGRHKDCMIVI